MRTNFVWVALAIILLGAILFSFHAQDIGVRKPASAPHVGQPVSLLTPTDGEKYASAENKAFAANPGLQGELEVLTKEGQALRERKSEARERQEFMEKMYACHQKLHAAMLKEDPSLGPILEQIDKHEVQMMALREKAAGGSN